MTASDYKLAGYEVGNQLSDGVILSCENDVMAAYVKPICGADAKIEDYKDEVMGLAFCLMLRRSAIKTRFGAEIKNTRFGAEIKNTNFGSQLLHDSATMMAQIAGICSIQINSLKSKTTLEAPYLVKDIIDCGYYIY